jgi:transposase, IS5 family
MIRDRYPPRDLFALVPLASPFEPALAQLDRLREDDQIFAALRADLARRRPHRTATGRPATPVAVILRLLVVKPRSRGSSEDTERFVSDRIVLRQFCRR